MNRIEVYLERMVTYLEKSIDNVTDFILRHSFIRLTVSLLRLFFNLLYISFWYTIVFALEIIGISIIVQDAIHNGADSDRNIVSYTVVLFVVMAIFKLLRYLVKSMLQPLSSDLKISFRKVLAFRHLEKYKSIEEKRE